MILSMVALIGLAFLPAPAAVPPQAALAGDYAATGLRVADYLLRQQNADGAIPDEPGGGTVNEDSNMEYALIGLAAAYWHSGDARYLGGLESGIHWLAAREEMDDPRWRGSWMYAYAAAPPYAPVPVSPGPGITDVRGVDATGALFVYLLHLHGALTGTDALAALYEQNARAALDFILDRNRGADGFFYSSWQRWAHDGEWRLWKFRYAADQADVYLGMQAGWRLYADARYGQAASLLGEQTAARFYHAKKGRFALGLNEDGSLERSLEGFNGIFPQGYLPWVLGAHPNNGRAYRWLKRCVQPNGSLSCYEGDPRFSLSVDVYALAAAALGQPRPTRSLDWLAGRTFDPVDGGVRDTRKTASAKYANVAGFTVAAFLGFPALPPADGMSGTACLSDRLRSSPPGRTGSDSPHRSSSDQPRRGRSFGSGRMGKGSQAPGPA